MEAKNTYAYQNLDGTNRIIGLRELDYQKPYTFRNLFFELANAADENDLLCRVRGILRGRIALERCKGRKISYQILSEKLGDIILKIKLKQETTYGTF